MYTWEYGEADEGVEVYEYEGCVVRDTGEVICKGGRNAWGYNESAKQISDVINVTFSGFDCNKVLKLFD